MRQFRTEAVIGFGLLAVLAIVLAITGIHLAQVDHAFEARCRAAGTCALAPNPIVGEDQGLQALVPIIALVTPALIGLFLGAPLIAREFETGTFRLAWTQSVSRRRWLAVKLGLVGLAAVAIAGLLTWLVDWWQSPFDSVAQESFGPLQFGFHGVAPIGYAAFAFALGVTAGVVLRRTVPAMSATLVGFVVARVAVTNWVRPNFAAPVHKSLSLLSATSHPVLELQAPAYKLALVPPLVTVRNGWVYATEVADRSGHAPNVLRACPALHATPASPQSVHACLTKLSATFHTVVTYQPATRFWPFQWAELGAFLAAALVLCAFSYWWLRRQYG